MKNDSGEKQHKSGEEQKNQSKQIPVHAAYGGGNKRSSVTSCLSLNETVILIIEKDTAFGNANPADQRDKPAEAVGGAGKQPQINQKYYSILLRYCIFPGIVL